MEHTFRQLQFDCGLLATLRTGLTRIVRWHLMEVFIIAFGNPVAPIKEHAPRRVRNRLCEMSVLYHVARFKFLGNNGIKAFMVKKPIRRFCEKVKALTGNNIGLLRQCILRFIPPSAPILLSREVAVKFHKFTFGLAIKAKVGYLHAIGSRQKILRSYIHTTSGFRDTFQRIRHFTNDKAVPAPRRLFQRDLFRVSDERTVLADFDFTELRHFQSVLPRTCFTNRVLTNAFVFSQTPRQRTDGTLKFRIPLFLCPLFATAAKMVVCCVHPFDGLHLHILRMLGIVRVRRAEFLEMVDLVIKRYRLATILLHLRTHLEHIVLQLLLVAQLRIKPLFLCFRRLRTELECYFHWTIVYRALTAFQVG